MSDNEKYYYLRLKEDFFEDDAIQILEAMPDGYLYSNILLKLYLKSLKFSGKLMFNERIPYNPTVLSTITRHHVGTVEKALSIFRDLGLIEILDNGAMYMLDIQNFIGKTSTEADRKRAYRERIEEDKQTLIGQMSGQISDKKAPEIEIKKEKEIKIEEEIKKSNKVPVTYVPDELLNQSILEFIDFRKKIKSPMTEKAITLLISNLEKLTSDNDEKIEILNQSIMNGWKGVFPLKDGYNRKPTTGDYAKKLEEWANG